MYNLLVNGFSSAVARFYYITSRERRSDSKNDNEKVKLSCFAYDKHDNYSTLAAV